MKIRLTEEIWKEGNMYVSYCPESSETNTLIIQTSEVQVCPILQMGF